jgi:hypothetical protein
MRSRTGPVRKKDANRLLRSMQLAAKTPNATTIAALEAADRGDVEKTSLAELARLWEGACAKSSRRRSSRKT